MGRKPLEQIIFEMGTVMLSELASLDDKLRDIVPLLSGYMNATKLSIMLINQDQMTLVVRASTNESIVGFSRNLSDVSISTRAIIDDKPFHVGSVKRTFFDPLDSSRYKSDYSLSVPIKHFDMKLGVINFTDFEATGDVDDETEPRAVAVIKHFAAYLYAVLGREQFEAKVSRLEEANREMRSMNEMRSSLTGLIMQDLKGPISTIVANLDMMGYDPLTSEQAECLNLATEDVYRMQNMVMDMLDVIKMEEGEIAIYRADADIRAMIEREAAAFANLLARRNMELRIDAVSHISYIDESLIGRVVVNILRNAISRTPDGGSITISACYSEGPKETIVSISDQGRGVAAEMRERIFEKYGSGGDGGRTYGTGSDMGLTFCQLIVEAHGGRIWVEDAESGGAKFVFSLPETLIVKGLK
jgi:signal transduction histidine kinase